LSLLRTVCYPVRLVTDNAGARPLPHGRAGAGAATRWCDVSIASREDSPAVMPSLREVRAARLLSIRELAQQAGVAPSTIYLIETDRVTPRPRVIRQLAAALGVEPTVVDEFRHAIERAQQPRGGPTDG
jgi:DNA-binding XRE family transcriptional regulator